MPAPNDSTPRPGQLVPTLGLFTTVMIVVGGGLVLYLFSRRAREALDARSYPEEDGDDDPAAVTAGTDRHRS